jgi:hypothetical protein
MWLRMPKLDFEKAVIDGDWLGQPVPFTETLAYGLVRGYLQRFSGIAIPERCTWPTYVLQDGPDDWELVMCAPDCYIHYRWSTAA